MELDKRIETLSNIITCFAEDKDRAKTCIGQIGYFSDDMMEFSNLENCIYGKLEDYSIDDNYPFRCSTDDIDHAFFIPELALKPKLQKKYRPYTLTEFTEKFKVGLPIKFRRKGLDGCERYLILDGYQHERYKSDNQSDTYIYIGLVRYTLQELFDDYEWQEYYTEDFEPFGVEE